MKLISLSIAGTSSEEGGQEKQREQEDGYTEQVQQERKCSGRRG